MNKQTEALKLALEGLEKWHFDKDPRGADEYIAAIREALAEESSGTEQPPCKTGSQCTSKCEQCRYKYDCDNAEQPKLSDYEPDGMHHNKPHKCKYPKCGYPCPDLPDCRDADQPAQQTSEEYDPDNRTISVYPSEWKAQQQEPDKDGSPCPEFWDWLPKAYNFDGDCVFTKYNMEVAFLAGKQSVANSDIFKERVDETQKQRHDATPPASKPWVGLSTSDLDEIDAPIRERGHATIAEIYRAIEAKLREKNA